MPEPPLNPKSIHVKYSLSVADLQRTYRVIRLRALRESKWRGIRLSLLSGIFLAGVVITAPTSAARIPILEGVAAVIAAYAGHLVIMRGASIRSVEARVRAGGERSAVIDDLGLHFRTQGSDLYITWANVTSVEIDKTLVYFFMGPASALPIPKHNLGTPAEVQSLVAEWRSLQVRAKEGASARVAALPISLSSLIGPTILVYVSVAAASKAISLRLSRCGYKIRAAISAFVCPVAVSAVGAAVHWRDVFATHDPTPVFSYILGGLVAALGALAILLPPKFIKKLVASPEANYITLTPQGIADKGTGSATLIHWRCIENAHLDGRFLYIELSTLDVICIPVSSFTSPEHANAFLTAIQVYASGNRPTDEELRAAGSGSNEAALQWPPPPALIS